MLLTTNCYIKSKNQNKLSILKELTHSSKDLYNKALYTIRQHFFKTRKYLSYQEVYHLLKNSDEYKQLPSNASQQTLKVVDSTFKSFFGLLKAKSKGEYDQRVKIPSYLDKNGNFKVIYTKIHLKILDRYIRVTLPKTVKKRYETKYLYFKIPKHIIGKEIKELRILPYKSNYKISFIYNNEDIENSSYTKTDDIMAIDLGINNLATVVTRYDKPIIFDGKGLKSKNRYFNKKISILQSDITKGKSIINREHISFKKIDIWNRRRADYIRDLLHKIANNIILIAINRGIGKIVIGYNKEWKTKCNMGRKNNEKFLSIPHSKLIEYIKYRAIQYKIDVVIQEESYTSKCDVLVLESIKKHKTYLGKRVKRGLFQSSIGKLINADVNGALNILRKSVSCNSLIKEIASRRLVFQPIRVFPYSC